MTVSDLLLRLAGAYPGATAEAMASFRPVFYARLRKHEGTALEGAYMDVLGMFKPTMRQPFPIPADFERHLPVGHPKVKADEKPLDLKGRRERHIRLMADWRTGQGTRAANGVSEVMQALEFIAGPIAGILAWNENPQPMLLKRSEVRLAQRRAISQQRRALYGPPVADVEVWWEQVSTIAAEWGVETTRDEWTAPESKTKPPPVAPRGPRPPFKPDNSPSGLRCAELAKEFHAKDSAARKSGDIS